MLGAPGRTTRSKDATGSNFHRALQRQEHGTIEKALQATQELSFPMVLLKARSTS